MNISAHSGQDKNIHLSLGIYKTFVFVLTSLEQVYFSPVL